MTTKQPYKWMIDHVNCPENDCGECPRCRQLGIPRGGNATETTANRLNEWSDNVHTLARNIRAAVKEAKRQGTTSISRNNLKQLTTTKGLTIAPSAFARCFEQALEAAEVNGFVY